MEPNPAHASARLRARTQGVLGGLAALFFGLAVWFLLDPWARPVPRPEIPPVERRFLETDPLRRTYADLVKAREDLSDYDCYACHDKAKPPPLRFDANHKLVIPREHENIVMGHGSHDRNDLCYNCHNEQNLATLQVRDGRQLGFDNIPSLCGSCHGPTYRDWEAGAHGRTGGHWDRTKGAGIRLSCANCHDPHSPRIPAREPAPGPHPLHASDRPRPPETAP